MPMQNNFQKNNDANRIMRKAWDGRKRERERERERELVKDMFEITDQHRIFSSQVEF